MSATIPNPRRLEAIKLVQSGLSYVEVGRRMGGISRQRVHQLVNSPTTGSVQTGNGRHSKKRTRNGAH